MGWVDGFITLIIIVSAGFGLFRGFVKEALSLVSWCCAFLVASNFAADLAPQFESVLANPALQFGAAYLCIFFAVLTVVSLMCFGIRRLIEKGGASGGGNDRLFGLGFGIARGVVIIGGIMLALRPTTVSETELWGHSLLIQEINPVADWLQDFLPDNRNIFTIPVKRFDELPADVFENADVLGAKLFERVQHDVESPRLDPVQMLPEMLEKD